MHKLLTFAGTSCTHAASRRFVILVVVIICCVYMCGERERKGPIFSYHAAMFPWTIYTVPL